MRKRQTMLGEKSARMTALCFASTTPSTLHLRRVILHFSSSDPYLHHRSRCKQTHVRTITSFLTTLDQQGTMETYPHVPPPMDCPIARPRTKRIPVDHIHRLLMIIHQCNPNGSYIRLVMSLMRTVPREGNTYLIPPELDVLLAPAVPYLQGNNAAGMTDDAKPMLFQGQTQHQAPQSQAQPYPESKQDFRTMQQAQAQQQLQVGEDYLSDSAPPGEDDEFRLFQPLVGQDLFQNFPMQAGQCQSQHLLPSGESVGWRQKVLDQELRSFNQPIRQHAQSQARTQSHSLNEQQSEAQYQPPQAHQQYVSRKGPKYTDKASVTNNLQSGEGGVFARNQVNKPATPTANTGSHHHRNQLVKETGNESNDEIKVKFEPATSSPQNPTELSDNPTNSLLTSEERHTLVQAEIFETVAFRLALASQQHVQDYHVRERKAFDMVHNSGWTSQPKMVRGKQVMTESGKGFFEFLGVRFGGGL